jgi:chorismate synthase
MSGNIFGKILRLTTFGESHGKATGGVIEGFPAGFPVDKDEIKKWLDRRKPSGEIFSTARKENDEIVFLSGIFEGKTLGTPIAFTIENRDAKSSDYEHLKDIYRPSHGDFAWEKKYGIRDYRGGGRSSARETAARVAAGALAMQYLESKGIGITAMVTAIGGIEASLPDTIPDKDEIYGHPLRCTDKGAGEKMTKLIEQAKRDGDSLGGIITAFITGLPAGLGEPVFDKFQARLASAMMSINAAKGFEYGQGFDSALMKGSEHNDVFEYENEEIRPATNNAGGILGGITTGEFVDFRVAFKPVASIARSQKTVDKYGKAVELKTGGRHDVTVLPRAVPVVEAMAALVVMDFLLLQKTARI